MSKELEQAFEKLLYNLSIAIYYQPYSDSKSKYMKMLDLIAKQKIKYDEHKDFNILSPSVLNDVHLKSLPLLEKYAIEDGNYAEQIEIWSDYLLNLQIKYNHIKGRKNMNNIIEKQKNNFNKNTQYIIKQLEYILSNIGVLKNDFYFEMSKNQLISELKKTLSVINKWTGHFNERDIHHIQKEYKEIEGIVSELELCLADYDNIFHIEGISYALYQIGNILIEFSKINDVKGSDKNV